MSNRTATPFQPVLLQIRCSHSVIGYVNPALVWVKWLTQIRAAVPRPVNILGRTHHGNFFQNESQCDEHILEPVVATWLDFELSHFSCPLARFPFRIISRLFVKLCFYKIATSTRFSLILLTPHACDTKCIVMLDNDLGAMKYSIDTHSTFTFILQICLTWF